MSSTPKELQHATEEQAEKLERAFAQIQEIYFTLEDTDLPAFVEEKPLMSIETFERLEEQAEKIREAAQEYREAAREHQRSM